MLQPGKRYRPLKSFMCGPHTFVASEPLVYKGYEGYSSYDDIDSYQFQSESDGTKKSWFVSRQRPESWDQYFALIDK
jgi:hypothetical protein